MNPEVTQVAPIGAQITAAMEVKGWDIKQTSTETGIPVKYLNKYIGGTMPRDTNLVILQQVLGIQLPANQPATNNGKQSGARKAPVVPVEPARTSWSFATAISELQANVTGDNFEVKVKHEGREITIRLRFGLHIEVKSRNGDTFEIEPRESDLRVACRSKDMAAASGGGRNVLYLKQID